MFVAFDVVFEFCKSLLDVSQSLICSREDSFPHLNLDFIDSLNHEGSSKTNRNAPKAESDRSQEQ